MWRASLATRSPLALWLVATVPTAATLWELLAGQATRAPDAIAFRHREETIRYADWARLAEQLAGGLAARGVRRGDVVALVLPTTPLYHVAYLAAARLGAAAAGVNVRYRRAELAHIVERAAPRLVVAVDRWHDADFTALVPTGAAVAWVADDVVRRSTIAAVDALVGDAPPAPGVTVDTDDPAAIIFTSGTTGRPKGAWYAHRNLLALAEIEARRHPGGIPPQRPHLAAGLSFAHVGSMARIAVQIGTLGWTIVHEAFDPAAVLAAIEHDRLPHLGCIPTQAIMLLDHPDRRTRDLSSLETVLLGGAPSAPALIQRVREELRVAVQVRYSSTEVGIATASLPDDPPEVLATTVGCATPGVELRVVDAGNTPLPAGEPGEVVVRSPATMRGYWRDPDATAGVIDAAGWVHTGDVGSLDATGHLRLHGRHSEMFIRGGYNVHPQEVEDVLARHPKVARVAVLGVPDPTWGEVGLAAVVPRDPDDPPTLAELRAFVGGELASFKRPDRVTVLRELPVTPMFKVDKMALRALVGATP